MDAALSPAVAAKAAYSRVKQEVRPPSSPSMSGHGKMAACTGVARGSGKGGLISPRALESRTPSSAPANGGNVIYPRQQWRPQQPRPLSGDEEEGRPSLLGSRAGRSDAESASVASVAGITTAAFDQPEVENLLIAPPASSLFQSLLKRGIVGAAKFTKKTAAVILILVSAFLAILTMIWALSPLCTTCVRSTKQPSAALASPAPGERGSSTLYINQLQVIGTHNSYHRRTFIPALSDFWDYHYPSLTAQLDAGIRHLELDIHYDWKTGRWFVFHLSILDPMSSCNCLAECLEEIKLWSDAHPAHHILFIEIELKLTGDFLRLCGQRTPDADHIAFRTMQETVLGEFPFSRILTPRQVRGEYETLAEAIAGTTTAFSPSSPGGDSGDGDSSSGVGSSSGGVEVGGERVGAERVLKGGWPLVDDTRGMVLFIIDYQTTNVLCRPEVRKALPADDTVFFERTPVDEFESSPLLAFGETSLESTIDEMVRSGVIVRNRVDDDTWALTAAAEQGGEGPRPTYVVETAAQLVVWNDMRAVSELKPARQAAHGSLAPLSCRTRCSAIVPEQQCVLEGFC